MKNLLIVLLVCFSLVGFGQKGITFEVEKLYKPKELLPLNSYNKVYEELILEDVNLEKWQIEQDKLNIDYGILAQSNAPDSLVTFGYNSFFNGMYAAYADHRPFVLSPDMIWLLISQGFSRHINANPEKYRDYFVDFKGKTSLVIETETDLLTKGNTTEWERVISEFSPQISKYADKEIINILTADFSTTTPVEKIASEITIMEAMKPYFEFIVMRIVCGIPEITLQGTPQDWEKVLQKAQKLKKYDLGWWISEIEPILKEFVNASKGKVKKNFWRNMFKYHTQNKYGASKVIDGWIVKFFPYDKNGKRTNLKEIVGGGNLPNEIVKVDIKYIETDGSQVKETLLELWSGFIGLEQNPENFALMPKIGWMIRKKDTSEEILYQSLKSQEDFGGISLSITEFPKVLKRFSNIRSLQLFFKKEIVIPEWFKEIKIEIINFSGQIAQEEIDKVVHWFPNSEIFINGRYYRMRGGKLVGERF